MEKGSLRNCLLTVCLLSLAPIVSPTALCDTVSDVYQAKQDTLPGRARPHSALFQKETTSQPVMGAGGLVLGLYVLIALVCSGLSGYIAIAKGLNPIPYFFLGFFLSVPGYLFVLTRPAMTKAGEVPSGLVKVPTTREPVPCPKCGFTNHPAAKKCLGCGAELQPALLSEVARLRQ